MDETLANDYTLIIPTYNRSAQFSRLIRYLDRRKVPFSVLVLDSSNAEEMAGNAQAIESVRNAVRHERFDGTIAPYEKFYRGLEKVETPYCSFCADDDVLFTDTIGDCVSFLKKNPFFIGAHGYYLNFLETDAFRITYTIHASATIAGDDAIKRLNQQMFVFEPVFYAIYRTDAVRDAVGGTRAVETLLFKELLASSIALVHGGICRIEKPYLARSIGPSNPYTNWHPHEIIPKEPQLMFREYLRYKEQVMARLAENKDLEAPYPQARRERIIDLSHLRYLASMLVPGILDFMIDRTMAGDTPEQVVDGIWQRWVYSGQGARPEHPQRPYPLNVTQRRIRKVMLHISEEWMGRKWHLGIAPLPWFDPYRDLYIDAKIAGGGMRRYLLYDEFLHQVLPNGRPLSPAEIYMMVDHFSDYD